MSIFYTKIIGLLNSNFFSNVLTMIAVFLGAYLGTKYFVKQQKIIRLEKYYFDDGLLTSQEIATSALSEFTELGLNINSTLIYIRDSVTIGNFNKKETLDKISALISRVSLFGGKMTFTNTSIGKTSEFLGKEFSEWIRDFDQDKSVYCTEVQRLLQAIEQEICKESFDPKTFYHTIEYLGSQINNLNSFVTRMGVMIKSLNKIISSVLEKNISEKKDIVDLFNDPIIKQEIAHLKKKHDELYNIYEHNNMIIPLGSLGENVSFLKKLLSIEGLSGNYPVFFITKQKINTEAFSEANKRRLTNEEKISLSILCFADQEMKKKINYFSDFLMIQKK